MYSQEKCVQFKKYILADWNPEKFTMDINQTVLLK